MGKRCNDQSVWKGCAMPKGHEGGHCTYDISGKLAAHAAPATPPPTVPTGGDKRQYCTEGCSDYPRCSHPSLPPGVLPESLRAPAVPLSEGVEGPDGTRKRLATAYDLLERLLAEDCLKPWDAAEVAVFISKIPPEFMTCDECGHGWGEHNRAGDGECMADSCKCPIWTRVRSFDANATPQSLRAEGRRQGLEEAAKAVEETDVVEARETYYAQLGDARATLNEAAKAIRALMEKP